MNPYPRKWAHSGRGSRNFDHLVSTVSVCWEHRNQTLFSQHTYIHTYYYSWSHLICHFMSLRTYSLVSCDAFCICSCLFVLAVSKSRPLTILILCTSVSLLTLLCHCFTLSIWLRLSAYPFYSSLLFYTQSLHLILFLCPYRFLHLGCILLQCWHW